VRSLREIGKKVLPSGVVDSYRRRRAVRRYLRSLGYELHDRHSKMELEELEGRILVRRPDITERLAKDILTRTDLLMQELDRQVEAIRARHGTELHELREQVAQLRRAVDLLSARLEGGPPGALSSRSQATVD
jgi:hypothetical protein